MPLEDEELTSEAVGDPNMGSHADSVWAVWHDPSAYDPVKHGPPYLPESTLKVAKVASSSGIKEAVRPLIEKMSADATLAMLVIIQHIKADFADAPMSMLAVLLAFLRAESMVHQAHHWQTRGDTAYGDHLMFDRIYNSVVEDIDAVAERMVGSGGHLLAQPVLHARHTSAVVQSFYGDAPMNPSADELPLISLRASLRTLVALKIVYGALEQVGLLSHGTDNLLQGVADKHEGHVFLLKQRSTQKTSYDRRGLASSDPRWKSG